MRRPCGPTARLAEHVQRRRHRGRIGVVAFVDQRRLAARRRSSMRRTPRPAAGSICDSDSAAQREIGAGQRRRRQHRQRIHRHVAAGHAELVGDVLPENVGMHRRAGRDAADSRAAAHRISRRRRTRRCARCRASWRARCSRANCELSRLSTTAPPGSTPAKISALASAIASMPAKNSRCTGSTVVMMATCGRTIFDQRLDFAGVIHADLEDRKSRRGRAARQRQRHAPMIVERRGRGVGLALRRRARAAAPPWSRSCRPNR